MCEASDTGQGKEQAWRKGEDDAIREYMGRTTSGIAGTKSLTWRFLVGNTAIGAFVLSYREHIAGAELAVMLSLLALGVGSAFIACHSFVKLKERRIELRELYGPFTFVRIIRPNYCDVVKYDSGDIFFLLSGIVVPISLFTVVYSKTSHDMMSSVHPAPCWASFEWWIVAVILMILGVAAFVATYCRANFLEVKYRDLLEKHRASSTTCVANK